MVASLSTKDPKMWSSRMTFILATIGFSVGLGNIWRFPYLAGENGGGAFVIIYIACVFLIGIPIVAAELAIGRRGGKTPAATLRKIATSQNKSKAWSWVGWLAIVTAFLINSYYCVIGGWTLNYVFLGANGGLSGINSTESNAIFEGMLANPWNLLFWQALFLVMVVLVVSRGIQGGIEKAVTILMPLLFILLFGLAIYGLVAGDAKQGLSFLFNPDFSKVSGKTFLDAIGQAFFSVGVGLAAMMTYGSFLSKDIEIPKTSAVVCLADTSVALIAGLAVFPFVFAFGMAPSSGPGLVFVTLPTALASLGGGGVAAIGFFILLAVAALTSAIALFEVIVSWGEEQGWKRSNVSIMAGIACWTVGLISVVSFNVASEFHPLSIVPGYESATMFDAIDKLTSNVSLPLGGLLVSIFAGWVMSTDSIAEELSLDASGSLFKTWRALVRFPIPLVIALLILFGVTG